MSTDYELTAGIQSVQLDMVDATSNQGADALKIIELFPKSIYFTALMRGSLPAEGGRSL